MTSVAVQLLLPYVSAKSRRVCVLPPLKGYSGIARPLSVSVSFTPQPPSPGEDHPASRGRDPSSSPQPPTTKAARYNPTNESGSYRDGQRKHCANDFGVEGFESASIMLLLLTRNVSLSWTASLARRETRHIPPSGGLRLSYFWSRCHLVVSVRLMLRAVILK
jgi:hypothetical protein